MTSPRPSLALPVARVTGPGDLVSTVPVLVGFEPQQSVVAVVLRDTRVALTMRVDLPPLTERWAWKALADTFVRGAEQAGGSAAVLVVYAEDREYTRLARTHLAKALRRTGVEVLDLLRVHDGRFWSLLCRDPACCPADGRPVPQTTAVHVAAAVDGRVVRRNRQALAEEFEPAAHLDAAEVTGAVRHARQRVPAPGPGRLAAVRALLDDALVVAEAGTLDLETAALLAAVVRDPICRDEAYRHLVRAPRQQHRRLWAGCCRLLTPQHAVLPMALFALVAYLDGDGAVANLAHERAAALRPDHPTVRLVGDMLLSALAPSVVIDTLARCVDA